MRQTIFSFKQIRNRINFDAILMQIIKSWFRINFFLEKAFDMILHKDIIKKLREQSLKTSSINWIKSFLKSRTFQVCVNGTISSSKQIKAGVPQGSCLSPTLFVLYFSDIADKLPPDVKVTLFADDLCISCTHKSRTIINETLQTEVDCIIEFCKDWGFKINKSKTCYTTFTRAGFRNNYQRKYALTLKIEDHQIPLETSPTFLGIMFW